jgi:hypothetical protein
MTLGSLIADIEWQFRWRTWLFRYLQVTTAIVHCLARHNLRLLAKMEEDDD